MNYISEIPSFLETHPVTPTLNPPVITRLQELPFEELSWESFEKLCYRIAKTEADIEFCRLYGKPGQKQHGIDLFARIHLEEKYRVYQCKREKKFGPSKIQKAVTEFLNGEWVDKTSAFILCTQEPLSSPRRLNAIEEQNKRLKKKGIKLEVWDKEELSNKLKEKPTLVDDFFGREYVKVFNGEGVAKSLRPRLDVYQFGALRDKLKIFYDHLFSKHDQGIPTVNIRTIEPISLHETYVVPGIIEIHEINAIKEKESEETVSRKHSRENEKRLDSEAFPGESLYSSEQNQSGTIYEIQENISEWLAKSQRNIVVGALGSGKSSLLRFLAMDLLMNEPTLLPLAKKWGEFLPLWVPFGYWTNIIDDPSNSDGSLKNLFKSWLTDYGEEKLWGLFEHALGDARVLLLVDGLDEGTSENATAIALERLLVFIEQSNIPAILTSRSHGFIKLRMELTEWNIGELSFFSNSQQRKLAYFWFLHWMQGIGGGSSQAALGLERNAEREADSFIDELQRSADLQGLAKIPLLLILLIYLRFEKVRLPENRFEVYDALVNHLLEHQKKRRQTASITTSILPDFDDRDIKDIFSHLAFYLQRNHPEGLIFENEAIETIQSLLQDSKNGFGYNYSKAKQLSRKICEAGQEVFALLVKFFPNQVGFFHRVLQQYLAAHHLSCLSQNEQIEVLKERCCEPKWREVLLGLFFLTPRSEDIHNFITQIQKKQSKEVDKYYIELLLSEIIFGDFNCTIAETRNLTSKIFDTIETDYWAPHRERLLETVINGLHTPRIEDIVKEKLLEWFPSRGRWRDSIYKAMNVWPKSNELKDLLWRVVHDEEVINQRAAAKILALKWGDNREIGKKLLSLVRSAHNADTRAVALEALIEGWIHDENTHLLINEAEKSTSKQLQLVSIKGKIALDKQKNEDFDKLIYLLEDGQWFWIGQDMIDLIIKGWPKSEYVKNKLLKSSIGIYSLLVENFHRILLGEYPQDEDVGNFYARKIESEEFPFSFNLYNWRLLSQNFRGHLELIQAIDKWIPEQKFREPEISFAALVGRTKISKDVLINHLKNSSIPFWAAESLLEGWGIKDKEISENLIRITKGSNDRASLISYLFPKIIKDKEECLKILLELLRAPDCIRPDFVLDGIMQFDVSSISEEIVTIVLKRILTDEYKKFHEENVIIQLIKNFNKNTRVYDFTLDLLDDQKGFRYFPTIAMSYSNDPKIRHEIIKRACPLPTNLRNRIAMRLREGVGDDQFALSILSLYDHEEDPSVKTLASIGYHEKLISTGADTKDAEDYLSSTICCYGIDHDARRQAAFCGLTSLKKLNIMLEAEERIGDEKRCTVDIHDRTMLNPSFLKHIIDNWEYIKNTFGEEILFRLMDRRPNPNRFWNTIAIFADQSPIVQKEAISFLTGRESEMVDSEILKIIARIRPRSKILQEYCLKAFKSNIYPLPLISAGIIGKHFGGTEILNDILPSKIEMPISAEVFIALNRGWPESEELKTVIDLMKDARKIPSAAYMDFICREASPQKVFKELIEKYSKTEDWHFRFLKVSSDPLPLIERVRADNELFDLILNKLNNSPTVFQKINYSKILSLARGLPTPLLNWCIKEINWQLDGKRIPEDGFDLSKAKLRPVVHSLLDILYE